MLMSPQIDHTSAWMYTHNTHDAWYQDAENFAWREKWVSLNGIWLLKEKREKKRKRRKEKEKRKKKQPYSLVANCDRARVEQLKRQLLIQLLSPSASKSRGKGKGKQNNRRTPVVAFKRRNYRMMMANIAAILIEGKFEKKRGEKTRGALTSSTLRFVRIARAIGAPQWVEWL